MANITRRTLTGLALSGLAGGLPTRAFAQATGSPAPAPSGEPIRIGYSMSLTGPLAGNGRPSLLAHQIWAEDVNARGGLLGRPVKLVYYDDQSSGSLVPGIYTKLLDVDKVDLLVSGYGTAMIAPAMPVVMQREMAFVALLGSAANDAFKYDHTVNISPVGGKMQEDFAKGFFDVAVTASPRPKTVALAGLDGDFPQRALQSARAQAKLNGIKVVYDRSYPPSTVDFSPIVRSIQSAKPDIVFFASYPADTVGLLRSVAELKLGATVLGGGMIGLQITGIKSQMGPALNNLLCWDVYAPEPTMQFDGITAFLKRYREVAVREKVEALGVYAPPLAYAQMQVLEQAVRRVGKIDQAAIGADFHANDFSTVIGELSFDKLGEWKVERNLYVQYQGVQGNDIEQFKRPGVQAILYPSHLRSGELRTPFPAPAP
ncbi:amino acid ABC transporter substrate-binding protein [Bosea sp. PAMC 26642]|uniref:amino acid ABC transporter substrate-binding protein n=1 Tax=Bosea sp. (strain PAMC 26642) TaxID=1792307 RepID=UPI0007703D00|nr:amino acid ABC transporter substrate-binding protein [Bosea sp. PAMC 26642]AMJ61126.1 branched-chain amino acid ABC transporter substrate-binding protein [Bosea sp. PAMC 26642]